MATMSTLRHFETSTTRTEPYGKIYEPGDGRIFRYVKAGAVALARGKLVVAPTVVANHINLSWQTAPAVGDTVVKLTLGATAATQDQYADGMLVVQDGAGEGRAYPIEGNLAADSAGTITVYLKEAIDTLGVVAETGCDLIASPYNGVVISVTDQADRPVGVPVVAIAAGSYGWVQSGGLCAVLMDEAVTNGAAVTIGTGVAGAVEAQDAAGEPVVGFVSGTAGVDTEYQLVDLAIDRATEN